MEAYFLDDAGNVGRRILKTVPFSISEGVSSQLNVTPPKKAYRNETVYIQLRLSSISGEPTWTSRVQVITYREPVQTAFNLLSGQKTADSDETENNQKDQPSVPFWLSILRVYMLQTPVSFTRFVLPVELAHLIRTKQMGAHSGYAPVLYVNPEMQKSADWIQIPRKSVSEDYSELGFTLSIEPSSVGKLRLRSMLGMMNEQLHAFGFKQKDIDDVRQLLVDTNFYFLLTTMFVSVFHLLFDFLAFKNDISFWRKAKTTAGLSMRTVVWRFFSSLIIFLHLREERSSMLVVIPMGISTCIELWKLARISKFSVSLRGGISWGTRTKEERETDELDAKFMYWLIWFMFPLCLAGSVYSLLYLPHRSWYSWCLQTLVNGVYAFGFLLMTPQLFLNYRLKSVAHLPWKALTYKAFNTFIDDFFAFIIVMPTSHRIACLRDDVIFMIYLYQRWLYPVDKSRVNEFGQKGDEGDVESKTLKAKEFKKKAPNTKVKKNQ
ncbi:unnamed protein product [Calicophoron daubneyi]